MVIQVAEADAVPMSEVNITPLIDVMLVLLVMFIITIPLQTHAVKLDLPTGYSPPPPNPVQNVLTIRTDGTVMWNGAQMDRDALRQELRVTQQMTPIPELHLKPEPEAPYGAVDDVLGLIKREHVMKMGFVGNEAYALR